MNCPEEAFGVTGKWETKVGETVGGTDAQNNEALFQEQLCNDGI